MNSDLDIRKLIEFAKTLDPETIRSNPKLAVLLNLESEDCPNLKLASNLKERFDRYRRETKKTGLSAHTRRSYESRINSFTGWLTTAEEDYSDFFQDVDCRTRAALSYKQHLQERNTVAPNTVNAFLTTLSHFCAVLDLEPPDLKREPRKHQRLKRLSTEDQELLLQAADSSKAQPRAIIYLLLKAGVRGRECFALNFGDYKVDEQCMFIIGKSETRRIQLDKFSRSAIEDWLTVRLSKYGRKQKSMFVNPQGDRLSEVGLRKIVNRIGRQAGFGNSCHPDLLRQTCEANYALQARQDRKLKNARHIYKDTIETLCNSPPETVP